MSTRKYTSPVWEYFDAPVAIKENGKDVVKVWCKLCGMQLVHGGSMTSLASHLSAKHTKEYTRSFGGPSSSKKQMTLPTIVLLNVLPQLLGWSLSSWQEIFVRWALCVVTASDNSWTPSSQDTKCLHTITSPRFVGKSSRRRRSYMKL